MFTLFLLNVVLFIAAELLRPKPDIEDREATPYEEANFPQIDPTRKIAVVLGAARLAAPHVADVTEYNTIALTQKVKTSIFSSKRQIIGHRYFVGMMLAFCHGPATLRKIYWDDEVIWEGTANPSDDGVGIAINLPDLLGGKENGGGLVGTMRWYGGSLTQQQDSYLAGFQSLEIAYRGTGYLVLENFEVGEAPNLSPLAIEVESYPNALGLTTTELIGRDMNPMNIVAEVFTNDDWGFGNDISTLEEVGITAVASTLFDEGQGMTLKLVNETKLDKVLLTVAKQVDGQHRYRAELEQWDYKLMRDDYVVDDLPKFEKDVNVIREQDYKRVNWEELVSTVKVNYSNRDTTAKPSPAVAHDNSLFDRLGGRNEPSTYSFPGVYDPTLANKLANRQLKKFSFPFSSVSLIVDRDAYDLMPGDAIVWTSVDRGIDQLVMRITKISLGTPDRREISISCVEDVFGAALALFSDPPASLYTPVAGVPVDVVTGDVYDQFYYAAFLDTDRTGLDGIEKPLMVAVQPQGNALTYRAEARIGTDPYVSEAEGAYTARGTLQNALVTTSSNIDELTSLVVENVSGAAKLDEFTPFVDSEIVTQFSGLILVDNGVDEPELMAYETMTRVGSVVTLGAVHRELADTYHNDYSIGAVVWFIGADGIATTLSEYAGADDVDIRYINVTSAGEGPGTLDDSIQFRTRMSRPYGAANLQVNTDRLPISTFPLATDFAITWSHRDRTTGRAELSDTISASGITNLETGFEYLLEIFDDIGGGSAIRTVQGDELADGFTAYSSSGAGYTYTNALQVTDGGPFARYRFELSVVDIATGLVVQLVALQRIVSVVVPLNFSKRGHVYAAAAEAPAGARWHTAEGLGLTELIGNTNVSTSRGVVGDFVPGDTPITRAVHIPGREPDGTVDWQGNLEFPHESELNFGIDNISHWFYLKFKIVADGQTDKRILVAQENTANPDDAQSWRLLIDSAGKNIEMQIAFLDRPMTVSYDSIYDDGLWHDVLLLKYVYQNNNEYPLILIDGALFSGTAMNGGASDTHVLSIGGYDDADTVSFGWSKMFFTLIQGHDEFALPYDGGTGTGGESDTDWPGMQTAVIEGLDWTPFQVTARQMLDTIWLRAPFNLDGAGGNGKYVTNWTGIRNSIERNGAASNLTNADQISMAGTFALASRHSNALADRALFDGSRSYASEMNPGAGTTVKFQTSYDWWNGGVGAALSSDGPATMTLYAKIMPTDLFEEIVLFHGTQIGTTTSQTQRNFGIWISTDGRINSYKRDSSGTDWRRQTTDDVCVVEDVIQDIFVIVGITGGMKVRVNGIEYTVDTADGTAGTPPGIDEWMDGRSVQTHVMRYAFFGQWLTQQVPVGSDGNFIANGEFTAYELGASERELTDAEMMALETAGLGPAGTLRDAFLDWNPENAFIVEDNTAVDLRGNLTGSVTASGTFTSDGEVPSGMDDESQAQRFSGAQDLVYTDNFLNSIADLQLDDFSFALVAMVGALGADMVFATNENGTPDTNFKVLFDDGLDRIEFRADGLTDIPGPAVAQYSPFCAVMTHEDDAGTDRWNWFKDGGRALAEATTANAYTGAAVSAARIGEIEGGGSLDLDGYLHYFSTYARTINPAHARRLTLRWKGFRHAMLWAHQFIDNSGVLDTTAYGAVYPMAEKDVSASGIENWVITDSAIGDLSGNATAVLGQAVFGLPYYQQVTTGNDLQGGAEVEGAYPFNMGCTMRVDSGTEAWASIWDDGGTSYIAIGVVDGDVRISSNAGATTDEDSTGVTVAVGDLVTISIAVISDTERRLYINGRLNTTFVTSINHDGNTFALLDKIGVNVSGAGASNAYNGSYSMLWWNGEQMDDCDHFRMHAEHMQPAWEQLSYHYAPVAQFLLNEPASMVVDVYRDKYNDDYNCVPSSTGVTQSVEGILPNRRDPCVELDGSNGGLDTNWLGYVAGSAERVIEAWLEPGFTGTVVSMGANTDAQALVISVDGSGDVTIDIRGASNAQIWTADLDTGTGARHLLVELPAAGDSLDDFDVYVDGAALSVGTAGTDTTLATTATLDLFIGEDVTDIAETDGNGKIYGVTLYDAEIGADGALRLFEAGSVTPTGHSW